MPDVVTVAARNRSGAPWANAAIEVYAMPATFTLTDGPGATSEPVFSGVTDAAGVFTFPNDPYVDPRDPTRLAYQHFMAIMSTHGPDGLEVGRALLPIYEAQLAVFEGRQYSGALQAAVVQRGDVLASGTVTSTDALALAKYLGGEAVHPSFPEVGDANCDGGVDAADPIAITRIAVGLPCGCP